MSEMDTSPETQLRLQQILAHEVEQTQALLGLLEQEYQLLKANPGKELEALLAQKQAQMRDIEQSARAHHQFLQRLGLSSDRRGTEAYLERCRENSSLQAVWQRYLALLQSCRRQNEINGGAVKANQRQVHQALDLLLGLGDGDKTYGRSGESRPGRASKTLGKA